MKNQRETALETFKAQSIRQDPISWYLWKRAFDEGAKWMLEQMPKWISVDDVNFPEKDLQVLCWMKELKMQGLVDRGYRLGYHDGKHKFSCETFSELIVTHWMPLPQPPKE